MPARMSGDLDRPVHVGRPVVAALAVLIAVAFVPGLAVALYLTFR